MQTKSAFVAIVGRPNVGKSSLLNALVGEKVAIVSNKPQTTRTRITGVLTKGETQYVLLDTPGLHKPKTVLSEYMVKQVNESVSDVDAAVLVTEAVGEITNAERQLMETFSTLKIPAVLAINKIDLLDEKEKMLAKIAEFSQAFPFRAVVPISVLNDDGIDELLKEISAFAKEGPHFFPDDAMTDQPERVIAAEIIREKMLFNLHEEVPHGTAVVIEKMHDRSEDEPSGNSHSNREIVDIDATIYCEKESHKGIVIGKRGAMLKKIATEARLEMESFFGIQVNLQCWVKVREDWRNRQSQLRNFGFQ